MASTTRLFPLAPLLALATATGCEPCLGLDGQPTVCLPERAADAGIGEAARACWPADPEAPDPTTVARPNPPADLAPSHCGRTPAWWHSPACVVSAPRVPVDGIDNDCDGMIDETVPGTGYPAPPPIPKASAYIFAHRPVWVAEATGSGCGRDDCAEPVVHMGLRCAGLGSEPTFDGHATALPRRADTCLRGRPDVCGPVAGRAFLGTEIMRCSQAAHTAGLAWDGHRLTLHRVESTDPRVPPQFTVGEYLDDLARLFGCVTDATAMVNTFGDPRDSDRDGLHDHCDCVVPPARDAQRCWLDGPETAPPSELGLPGLLECPAGAPAPRCTQQPAWPTIQAWFNAELDADWDDPAVQAEALAASAVTIRWLDVAEEPLPNAAVSRTRVQAGRDYERYVQRALGAKWGLRFQQSYSYHPPPLDLEMEYFAAVDMNGLLDVIPVARPDRAPERVQRRGQRTRWADGYIQDHQRTHGRGVIVEAKCLNPFARFDPRRQSWSWMMQIGFTAQLADYLNHARRSWGRGEVGTPPIKIQYFFCDFIPRWVSLQMVSALAAGAPPGYFGAPEVRFGPAALRGTWMRSPVWYPDALGLADGVGTAIENWEGFVPWGQEGGDWLMNVTGGLYDQMSGSE